MVDCNEKMNKVLFNEAAIESETCLYFALSIFSSSLIFYHAGRSEDNEDDNEELVSISERAVGDLQDWANLLECVENVPSSFK